jgi:hypothetical protein
VADSRKALLLLILIFAACSRLSELTRDTLHAAQTRWEQSGPANYHMIVEMSGDRIEASKYDVTVRSKQVVKLERNGQAVPSGSSSESFSVDGLFAILDEEIELTQKPVALGAPPGYSSYPMASFDNSNGRLVRFQRSVGGTKNSIEIRVREFEILKP